MGEKIVHNYKLCKQEHNYRLLLEHHEKDVVLHFLFFTLELLDGVLTTITAILGYYWTE